MRIKDLTFVPLSTESEVDLGWEWLIDNKDYFKNTSNFAIVGGDVLTSYIHLPCHRMIKNTSVDLRSCVATECGWQRRFDNDISKRRDFEPFFEWLTKRSVYSRFILKANLDIGFIVSADVHTPLMQNILIITRHFYEVPLEAFKVFNKMVEEGISEEIAYPLVFNTSISSGYDTTTSQFKTHAGHRVSPPFTLEAYRNFLLGEGGQGLGESLNNPDLHYRRSTDYKGGSYLFWDIVYGLFDTRPWFISELMQQKDFKDVLASYRKGKTNPAMYVPPNPFAPKPQGTLQNLPPPGQISNEEAIALLPAYLSSILADSGLTDRKES